MNQPDPVPSNFGFRYVAWFIWLNSITALAILQGALASVMLLADDSSTNPLLSHTTWRMIVLANAILTGIIAQVKKNNPPSAPPPTKGT